MPDEYISREAALKALFAPGMCYAPMQLQIIKDLPAADVAEVVRCKTVRFGHHRKGDENSTGHGVEARHPPGKA